MPFQKQEQQQQEEEEEGGATAVVDFPRSGEVYFALGLLAADNGAALMEASGGSGDAPDPGAASRDEVLEQIKAARRAAMKERQDKRRQGRRAGERREGGKGKGDGEGGDVREGAD